jgi:hypothetical protein
MNVGTRRTLIWSDLNQVLEDVENLRVSGYRSVGKWNLAQCCGHIADWMTFPLAGFPPQPWFIRAFLSLLKLTMGKAQLRKILRTRSMRSGNPTMPETVYLADTDVTEEVERLKRAVQRLQESHGPYQPSPLFGDMSREDLLDLQVIHAAHHLSFLIPQKNGDGSNFSGRPGEMG